MGEAALDPPVASKEALPASPIYSPNGQLWDNMGIYGRQWKQPGEERERTGYLRETPGVAFIFR
jgi:hypothetical protein